MQGKDVLSKNPSVNLFRDKIQPLVQRAVLGYTAKEQIDKLQKVVESIQPDIMDTRDSAVKNFRLSSGGMRDFAPYKHTQITEMAFYLYQRNPLARRLIQIVVDYCLGDELQIKINVKNRAGDGTVTPVDNNRPQERWDDFANDEIEGYLMDIDIFAQDLLLYGELILPVIVEGDSADVKFGYIDSALLTEVKPDAFGRTIDTITYSLPMGNSKTLKVVNYDDMDKLQGEVFFHRINRVMNQLRGHSELMEMLDWIDALDQFMFNSLEASTVRNMFIWTLSMQGLTKEQIEKLKIDPPRPASVKVTNEKATWGVLSPSVGVNDQTETVRMYKNFILGGKGYPEHFFGDGGNANRATAGEMSQPTMRMLKRQQAKMKTMIKQHALFVVTRVSDAELGMKDGDFLEVEVQAVDFERKDAAVLAAGFTQTVSALVTAASRNWISDDKAKQVIDGFTQQYGVETNPDETVEGIAEENNANQVDTAYPQFAPDREKFIPRNQTKSANASARMPKENDARKL